MRVPCLWFLIGLYNTWQQTRAYAGAQRAAGIEELGTERLVRGDHFQRQCVRRGTQVFRMPTLESTKLLLPASELLGEVGIQLSKMAADPSPLLSPAIYRKACWHQSPSTQPGLGFSAALYLLAPGF